MIEFGSFCLKQDSWFCFNGESPRAHLHVGGDVAVDVFDVNQPSLPTPFLFCSCVCFCRYGPFNCISFYEFSQQLSRFLTLFFRSYFCLIGPFNYLSPYENLPQP